MGELHPLTQAIIDGDKIAATELTQRCLEEGEEASAIIEQRLVPAAGYPLVSLRIAGIKGRGLVAKLRAAVHQYALAEQGLAEALGRAVGSGCYVSDFYRQPEWSLLSRAMENQETAQHQENGTPGKRDRIQRTDSDEK